MIYIKETVTATKAAKNFGEVIKAAEEDGAVRITKRSDSYILIREEEFNKLRTRELWGLNGEAVVRAEIGPARVLVELIDPSKGKDGFYRCYDLPADYAKVSIQGAVTKIVFTPEDYEANWRSGNVAWAGVEAFLHSKLEVIKDTFDMDIEMDRQAYESTLRARYLIENKDKAKGKEIIPDIKFW